MYSVKPLSNNDTATYAPEVPRYQETHLIIGCLTSLSHQVSLWPYGNTTHKLRQESPPGEFHSQKICNGLIYFSDGGEGRSPKYKRTIACAIICLSGVAVHWSGKTKPASAANSTDSRFLTFYLATKMVQWHQPILKSLGFQFYDAPTPIYEDIQPTIDIIERIHFTIRVNHIAVPIQYVQGKYFLLTIDNVKSKTTIQKADIGNKISTVPLLKRH